VQAVDGGGEQRQRPEADGIEGRLGPSCEIHVAASPADEPDLEVNAPPPQLPGATRAPRPAEGPTPRRRGAARRSELHGRRDPRRNDGASAAPKPGPLPSTPMPPQAPLPRRSVFLPAERRRRLQAVAGPPDAASVPLFASLLHLRPPPAQSQLPREHNYPESLREGWGMLLDTLLFCSTRFFSSVLHIVPFCRCVTGACWRVSISCTKAVVVHRHRRRCGPEHAPRWPSQLTATPTSTSCPPLLLARVAACAPCPSNGQRRSSKLRNTTLSLFFQSYLSNI
jgi:hypothetical protein